MGAVKVKIGRAMSQFDLALSPWTTVRDAARIMRDEAVCALPVAVENRPIGIVTGHDLVTRLLPERRDAGARPVSEAMRRPPICCFADQDVTEAAALMGDAQTRYLVVLDRSGGLVGMISVEDIALNASEHLAGQVLGEIVERRARPQPSVKRPE
jgi:CBS domain-containing protein